MESYLEWRGRHDHGALMSKPLRHALLFLVCICAAGYGIPGPQGAGLAQTLAGATSTGVDTFGEGNAIIWNFANGDSVQAVGKLDADGNGVVDFRAFYGPTWGNYDGSAVIEVGGFVHDGAFLEEDGQFWAMDNYGLALGVFRGVFWHQNSSTYSDVTGNGKEIALYSSDSGSTGMGPHILRLAGRSIGAPDPGFPWDYSGIGTAADLDPVYLSLAGVAPMVSSSTFVIRDEGGDPAITVETDGVATFAAAVNHTQTASADSTTPTLINLPTGGTAAQAGWVAIEVNGSTAWMPYWQVAPFAPLLALLCFGRRRRTLLLSLALLSTAGCVGTKPVLQHSYPGWPKPIVGTAWPAYLTVGHVARWPTVQVGSVVCDTYRLDDRADGVVLLVPRAEPMPQLDPDDDGLYPGDSGYPIRDDRGRVVGLHLGPGRMAAIGGGE